MGVRLSNQAPAAKHRWIKPYVWAGASSTLANGTAGKVRGALFEISEPTLVDGVTIMNYAVVDGNVTVGIYGNLTAEETAVNSAVLAESASTALAGANSTQFIPFASPVTLPTGRYYVVTEFSSVTHTFGLATMSYLLAGFSFQYDRAGGYGALTNPCPAVTFLAGVVSMIIRCVQ